VDPRSPDPTARRQLCAWLERRHKKGMGLNHADLIGTVRRLRVERACRNRKWRSSRRLGRGLLTVIALKGDGHGIIGDPRPAVTQYVAKHTRSGGLIPRLRILVQNVGDQAQKTARSTRFGGSGRANTR